MRLLEGELLQRREGRNAGGEGGGAGVPDLIVAAMCVCVGAVRGRGGVMWREGK